MSLQVVDISKAISNPMVAVGTDVPSCWSLRDTPREEKRRVKIHGLRNMLVCIAGVLEAFEENSPHQLKDGGAHRSAA